MGAVVLGAPRHQAEADRRQRERERRDHEDDELDEIDQRRPGERHQAIVAGVPGDDAEDLPRGLRLRRADGLGDARLVGLRDHHQLPDAPPPPNEPPPPENPPPPPENPPPENPPE